MRYLSLWIIGGVAVAHLVATYAILVATFPLWFAAPEHPVSRVVSAVLYTLMLPLGAFYWGWSGIDLKVIGVFNSLIWGLAAYASFVSVEWVRRGAARRDVDSGTEVR